MYFIARRVALVTVIFAAILSILLIANYIQTKSIDPLNSQAIAQLMQQLQEDPQNEALKGQIRALDLLARRAYFTHQWQLRAGGYLLFAFVLIFLIAFKYMSSFRTYLPELKEAPPPDDTWQGTMRISTRSGRTGLDSAAPRGSVSRITPMCRPIGTGPRAGTSYGRRPFPCPATIPP
jgi:flagellar biosynthesis/type III secretory pathway M-ring protein FliF/YscJ